jgi:hypothetical protein
MNSFLERATLPTKTWSFGHAKVDGHVGEGGIKSLAHRGHAPRGYHAQIFFLQPELLISFKRIQINQTPGFKGVASSQAGKIADLFSGGGGGQKLCNLQSETGGLATRIFSPICENFFWQARDAWATEILSRNSGWGGGG